MTPVGLCPGCGSGHLIPCVGSTGWTRCPRCCTTFDHEANAYDSQMRLVSAREGT